MKRIIAISCIIAFGISTCFISCGKKNRKSVHVNSFEIHTGVYIEKYWIYAGGVAGGDVYAYYLTDSLSFREYIGNRQDREFMKFDYLDGIVEIKKTSDRSYERGKTLKVWALDVSELKKLKVVE